MISRLPKPRSQSANTTRPAATARTSSPRLAADEQPFPGNSAICSWTAKAAAQVPRAPAMPVVPRSSANALPSGCRPARDRCAALSAPGRAACAAACRTLRPAARPAGSGAFHCVCRRRISRCWRWMSRDTLPALRRARVFPVPGAFSAPPVRRRWRAMFGGLGGAFARSGVRASRRFVAQAVDELSARARDDVAPDSAVRARSRWGLRAFSNSFRAVGLAAAGIAGRACGASMVLLAAIACAAGVLRRLAQRVELGAGFPRDWRFKFGAACGWLRRWPARIRAARRRLRSWFPRRLRVAFAAPRCGRAVRCSSSCVGWRWWPQRGGERGPAPDAKAAGMQHGARDRAVTQIRSSGLPVISGGLRQAHHRQQRRRDVLQRAAVGDCAPCGRYRAAAPDSACARCAADALTWSSMVSALPWSAVISTSPPMSCIASTTRPRHSSSTSIARVAAARLPVWPTMSPLA